MNFKKRVNGSWVDTPNYIHNTSTDTITTFPAVLYPNAATATVGLKGNTVQNGTPSPASPIQPQECGNITANMLSVYKENYSINANGAETYNNVAMIYKANVGVSGSTFTLDFGGLSAGDTVRIHAYTGDTWKEQIAAIVMAQAPFAFTVASEVDNIRISIRKTAADVTMTDGQYKIPILSANTTTPVYLGEVQTTRQIKKLVLTGREDWVQAVIGVKVFRINVSDYLREVINIPICTHYKGIGPVNGTGALEDLETAFLLSASGNNFYYIRDDRFNGADDFKSYLAQQYANGTPVTVWYVLATPTTGIVNEPIRKIGEYADTVSGITIPTITGADTLSVGTTLQPSEITVKYKGWHPVNDVHERENSSWD